MHAKKAQATLYMIYWGQRSTGPAVVLYSIVFIICPMNGVDWHFIVLIGGDGAGCVPASRLLSLGGGGDHCLLRLSASVKAQWLALGRCLECGDGLVL